MYRSAAEVHNDYENVEMLQRYLYFAKPLVYKYLKGSSDQNWSINQDYIDALIQTCDKKLEYYEIERLIVE